MKRKPRAIDLFCGAGGLTEGLSQAGYMVVGAIERDPLACEAYRLNHPLVRLWEKNIKAVTVKVVMKELGLRDGQLDLLAACPPCQGFSSMRTKNGNKWNKDFRNSLISEVLRFARELRPKALMLENVPGLAKTRKFKVFKKQIRSMGYQVKEDVLNAVDYAVPQSRRRLILIAAQAGEPKFSRKVKMRKTVWQGLKGLTPTSRSRDPLHNYTNKRTQKVIDLIKKIPKNGGSRMALGKEAQLECHKNFEGFKDVYGRMSWKKPSPTITGGCINPSKGRFLHPVANRAITLREAAMLQTFPKTYKFPLTKGRFPTALLIGNALPPEFIKRHAQALRSSVLTASH